MGRTDKPPHSPIRSHSLPLAGLVVVCLLLSGCAFCHHKKKDEIPCYWANGTMGDYPVETCVDSPWAQYYLNYYSRGISASPQMDAEIEAVRASLPQGFPSREQLRFISNQYNSTDFASLLLAEKLAYEDPFAQPFKSYYREETDRIIRDPTEQAFELADIKKDTLLVVVPGAFWESSPELNGDFGIQRRYLSSFGWQSLLIRTADNGVVEENACCVAQTLRRLRATGKKIVIFSASRGGAETYYALGNLLAPWETDHIIGWVNVVGTPRGTPTADEVTTPPLSILVRVALRVKHLGSIKGAQSLRTDRRRASFAVTPPPPPHIAIVNYVALPLSGHIREDEKGMYERIRKYGPNDGVTLTIDSVLYGYPTLTAFGFDHRMRKPDTREDSLAVLRALFRWIEYRNTPRGPEELPWPPIEIRHQAAVPFPTKPPASEPADPWY